MTEEPLRAPWDKDQDALGQLAEMGLANNLLRPAFGGNERGQQQRCQNADDGNDHQQFNQGKTPRSSERVLHAALCNDHKSLYE